ncbi:MAG: hypothetical protein ACTHU0_07435 [Kofleriaceae bacterium]
MRVACGLCLLAAGCVPDRPIAAIADDCREQMGEVVYEHACQHGALGPYESVEAVATATASLPTVDGAQRVLDIRLPAGDPDGISYLRYVATRDGQHAVFSGAAFAAVRISVLDRGAEVSDTPLEPMPDPAGCGGMVEVTGFELTAGESYVFALGPTTAPGMRMFIEHLATFGEGWSERCFH